MWECDLQKRKFLKNAALAGIAGGFFAMSQPVSAGDFSQKSSKASVFNVCDFYEHCNAEF